MFFVLLPSFLGLIAVFCVICLVCEQRMVPSVEVFIREYRIPEELAAVTLVAFGSASPELLLNTVSAVDRSSDLSLPAILGSAIIAFGLIPGLCFAFGNSHETTLHTWPIIREVGFYLLGLTMFLESIQDGKITTLECASFVSVYILYVFVVASIYIYSVDDEGDLVEARPLLNDVEAKQAPTSIGWAVTDSDDGLHGSLTSSDTATSTLINTVSVNVSDIDGNLITTANSASNESIALRDYELCQRIPRSNSGSNTINSSNSNSNNGSGLIVSINSNNSNLGNSLSINASNSISNNGNLSYLGHADAIEAASTMSTNTMSTMGSNNGYNSSMGMVNNSSALNISNGNSGSSSPRYSMNLGAFTCCVRLFLTTTTSLLHRIFVLLNLAFTYFSMPVEFVMSKLFPDIHAAHQVQTALWRPLINIVLSVACIGIGANLIIHLCEGIVDALGIDRATVGATLLAIGSEIPDTISSITLARSGYSDAAIAGAIGSQVINISIAAGLPSLILCLSSKKGYFTISLEQTNSLSVLVMVTFLVISVYFFVVIVIPVFHICACQQSKAQPNRPLCIIDVAKKNYFNFPHRTTTSSLGGFTLIATFVIAYFIVINYT